MARVRMLCHGGGCVTVLSGCRCECDRQEPLSPRRPPRSRLFGLVGFSAVLLGVAWGRVEAQERLFVRGDANVDGKVSFADVFSILGYLHKGGPAPCLDASDADDSGRVDFADAITVLILVAGSEEDGLVPVGPFPRRGVDPTPDALDCAGGFRPEGAGAAAEDEGIRPAPQALLGAPCENGNNGAELEFIHFGPGSIDVFPGQEDVRLPLFLETVIGDLEGMTLSLFGDPDLVRLESLRFAGPFVESRLSAVSWTRSHESGRARGYLAASLGLDIVTSSVTLPETPSRQIAELVLSVSPDARPGDEAWVEFRPMPRVGGRPEIPSELIRGGQAQPHGACPLVVRVRSRAELFLRGDADRDGNVDLSDALLITGHLFAGIPVTRIPCPDAADADDDGQIGFPDAVLVLRYLFARGAPPFPPFPRWGRDSDISDSLGCEGSALDPDR